MKEISLLIVEDHPVVRDGVKHMLVSHKGKVNFDVDEAKGGEQCLKKIARKKYDVILMDVRMPDLDGIETTKAVRAKGKDTKIIAFSSYNELNYIIDIIEAGANGYVLKNADYGEIITAVQQVMAGQKYFSSEVSTQLITPYIDDTQTAYTAKSSNYNFSERELEVIRLVAQEKKSSEIADDLGISKRTVDTHRRNIMNKLAVNNTAGLIKKAIKLDLI